MILRQLSWILVAELLYLVIVTEAQNERSYDTNDWIPITPTSKEATGQGEPVKRQIGRVLNLDSPAQKFFPHDEYEYRKRRPEAQQYSREAVPNNGRYKQKNGNQYNIDTPQKNVPKLQYFTNQEVKLPAYEQPPPLNQGHLLEKPLYLQNTQLQPQELPNLTRQQAPAVNAPNIYRQYNIPFNNSFYQSLNPTSINQEILSAVQNQPVPLTTTANPPLNEKESIQLLYVPLENLRQNQPITQNSDTIFRQVNAPQQDQQVYNQNQQHLLDDIEQDYIQQTVQAHRLQQQIHLGQPVVFQTTTTTTTTTTTPKPKKRKPHQPPLSLFMENDKGADISDVIEALRQAKSIAVQDSVQPNSPKIFVGPSAITLPPGYNKFPLPYLNRVDGNRVERKIDDLPFFVAPLSYKAPPGYSKIPLPSPHVGSVVVNNKEESHKRSAPLQQNQINEYQLPKQTYSIPVTAKTNVPETNLDVLNQHTYYSSIPLSSSSNGGHQQQQPQSIQFHINGNVNQLTLPKTPQVQIKPDSLSNENVNTLPTRTHYNTVSDKANTFINPNVNADNINKYTEQSFSNAKDTSEYKIPSTTQHQYFSNENIYKTPSTTAAQNTPIKTSYQQHSFSNEDSYSIPSRVRHPTTENLSQQFNIPEKTSTIRYSQPTGTFSGEIGAPEVSITPKPTTTKPIKDYSEYLGSYITKQQNPLDLAINQYELHQINSQLVEDKPDKTKNPFDFTSNFRYENNKPKGGEFDYSSQFEVDKEKVKDSYDYISLFGKPKFDYTAEYDRYTSTPATILRDTHEDITTRPPTTKSRRRGKPTRQPTKTTTQPPVDKEPYTVLEEFNIRQPTTHSPPQNNKYLPEYTVPTREEVADTPANVYRIKTTSPKYDKVTEKPSTTQDDSIKTEIEDIPAKVYDLPVNQSPIYSNPSTLVLNQNLNQQVTLTGAGKNEDTFFPSYQQQSKLEANSYSQYDGTTNVEPLVHNRGQELQTQLNTNYKPLDIPDYTTNLQDQSVRTLLIPNLLVPTTEHHQQFNAGVEIPAEDPTTTTAERVTTTTTEKPVERTAPARTRSRQRGGSRFTTAATPSASSTPRRPVNRRRPVHYSRTTTTESPRTPTTQDTSREDFQRVNTRQKVRSRGRPAQNIAERISTTENDVRSYNEPTSESAYQSSNTLKEPQSYMQFAHTIQDQKIIVQQDDASTNGYQPEPQPQFYHPPAPIIITENPRVVLQYDNTATTPNPVMDIQVTHPVVKTKKQPLEIKSNQETQIHVQSGGVLYNNRPDGTNSRQTGRVRGKARTRSRFATTTERPAAITTTKGPIKIATRPTTRRTTLTTTSTTEKPVQKSSQEDEFFGFIRQPNFNQIYNIQVASATQPPLQIYQNPPDSGESARLNSYHVTKNQNVRLQSYVDPQNPEIEDVRLEFNSEATNPPAVQFVGEIRPKYKTTTQNFEQTTNYIEPETPRPRTRGRARIPQRKSQASQRSNAEVNQATRRSNVVRSRGRGTAHYRVPDNLKEKQDKEADVEGGNYPPSFFQNRQATVQAPTFQISVDPLAEEEDGDQLPNSSLYKPNFIPRPDNWTEVTEDTINFEDYAPANEADNNVETSYISAETALTEATDQPVVLDSTESATDSSDETYRENTKAAETIFEQINEHSATETTTEKQKQKGRRRGVWKLVRQRPVDQYEVAESQNYYSVVNSFGDIVKVSSKASEVKGGPKTSKDTYVNHQAYNNYNPLLEQNSEVYDYESQKLRSTEEPVHQTDDYEYGETNSFDHPKSTEQPESPTKPFNTATETENTTTTTAPKESTIFDSIYEMFGISSKSDEDKQVPTTITPITEQETLPPTTTITISPTFPEEMTEIPTTTLITAEKYRKNATIKTEDTTELLSTDTVTLPKPESTRTFEVEPWEMKAIRTSTSTEVSHETEICYKGRCVRSPDHK